MHQPLQWYAIRIKPTVNRGRSTSILGSEYTTYRDRRGQHRKRRVNGTGQREFVIEVLLRQRGFEVFLPTKKVWRQISRYNKQKKLVTYPLLIGWAFVGWPEDETRWLELFDVSLVKEVVSVDGKPLRVSQETMERMFKQWGGQKTSAHRREKFMRTHREFNVNDKVIVADGPFAEFPARVIDIRDNKARILMQILGGERVIEVETQSLEAA